MPTIEERLLTTSNDKKFPLVNTDTSNAPDVNNTNQTTIVKSAHTFNRSSVPPEFMYDFDINTTTPSSPYFTRRNVGIDSEIRNLARQAFQGKV